MAKKKSGERTLKPWRLSRTKKPQRKNIPTAEFQSVMPEEKQQQSPDTLVATLEQRKHAISTRNWSGVARMSRTGPI